MFNALKTMKYPDFFNRIETIKLRDELSNFLGTFEDGIVEFSYVDIVKAAGHSCPTVAGAYLLTFVGLKELYQNEIPKRGEIAVSFKEDVNDGVAGVIANVVTQITGATQTYGFKGINGNFKRYGLMQFNDTISSSIKFTRLDTNKTIELIYNPNSIPSHGDIPHLMQKIFTQISSKEEVIYFGQLWQQRVENIFNNIDKVVQIK